MAKHNVQTLTWQSQGAKSLFDATLEEENDKDDLDRI